MNRSVGGEKNVIIFKTDISFCHRSSQIRACDNTKYTLHRSIDREKRKLDFSCASRHVLLFVEVLQRHTANALRGFHNDDEGKPAPPLTFAPRGQGSKVTFSLRTQVQSSGAVSAFLKSVFEGELCDRQIISGAFMDIDDIWVCINYSENWKLWIATLRGLSFFTLCIETFVWHF